MRLEFVLHLTTIERLRSDGGALHGFLLNCLILRITDGAKQRHIGAKGREIDLLRLDRYIPRAGVEALQSLQDEPIHPFNVDLEVKGNTAGSINFLDIDPRNL